MHLDISSIDLVIVNSKHRRHRKQYSSTPIVVAIFYDVTLLWKRLIAYLVERKLSNEERIFEDEAPSSGTEIIRSIPLL